MNQIKSHAINSLLDTDLYKFTMQQTVLHKNSGAEVEYHFRCRTDNVDLVSVMNRIEEEIDHLCNLHFKEDEINYLRTLRFFKKDYIDFLENFNLKRRYITVSPSLDKKGSVDIIIKGPWVQTILFEVPVLAIINQVYYEHLPEEDLFKEGMNRLNNKIEKIKTNKYSSDLLFSDFGTRRRFNFKWQEIVVNYLKENLPEQFRGTSNVLLAYKTGLTPIGTMAHEYLQAYQVLGNCHISQFQTSAFEDWAQEYRGDLGIALTDVIGLESFLEIFDLYFCKLFDGVRHDSGDPFVWGDKIIEHYRKNRVDPKTKILTFSDGLNTDKMLSLHEHFREKCKPNFGVGTHFTNDLGLTPLQVVIKMVRCNGQPVAKLSDAIGKTMSDDKKFVEYLRHQYSMEIGEGR